MSSKGPGAYCSFCSIPKTKEQTESDARAKHVKEGVDKVTGG